MIKKMILVLFFANSLSGAASQAFDHSCLETCGKSKQKSVDEDGFKVQEISAEQLLEKINNKELNMLVVNVLGERYYEDAHIAGSISGPLKVLDQVAKGWDKNKLVIVYCACRECDASLKAAKLLVAMGFKNVLAYEGGIREWYKKGYPCGGPCKEAYLNEEGDSSSTKIAYCFCADACNCVA